MNPNLVLDLHLGGADGDFRPATDFARWSESAPAAMDFVASEPAPMAVPQAGLSHATVMIVDDDPRMTDAIRGCLQAAGLRQFVTVHDPQWVLDSARRHRPGLMLLNLGLADLAGFEILERIREDERLRYIPVIGLAAPDRPDAKLRALGLGAVEVLSTPLDANELVLRVRNGLAMKVYQDRLANEDPLTGLPNRRVFLEQLRAVLTGARARRGVLALLHIGMDRFKQINDSLGDKGGDLMLGAVAQRLQSTLRRSDGRTSARPADAPLLSRMGGDEFALLLPEIQSPEVAGTMARRILAAMSRPFQHEGRDLFVTPSIGIAVWPTHGQDEDSLRRHAVAAMAHAKASGRNTYRFFSNEIKNASRDKLGLETRLRRAIERDELLLHYQPKIALASGRMVGAEVLLRWRHPELGLVPPDQFIPLAEESGLIVEIGEWVVDRACAQMARWRAAGQGDVKLAVNISGQDMFSGDLVGMVGDAIRRHGIRPRQLVLELTEGTLMDRVEHTRAQLEALRALGVEISIDDFGTGFSSMSYLKRYPLDELKIDKSFISGTPTDSTDVAIVKAIIALAHSLDLRVVAEGVETESQRAELQALGCDIFQGYLCSKPLPAASFIAKVNELNSVVEVAAPATEVIR